jgi:hypothetical protein
LQAGFLKGPTTFSGLDLAFIPLREAIKAFLRGDLGAELWDEEVEDFLPGGLGDEPWEEAIEAFLGAALGLREEATEVFLSWDLGAELWEEAMEAFLEAVLDLREDATEPFLLGGLGANSWEDIIEAFLSGDLGAEMWDEAIEAFLGAGFFFAIFFGVFLVLSLAATFLVALALGFTTLTWCITGAAFHFSLASVAADLEETLLVACGAASFFGAIMIYRQLKSEEEWNRGRGRVWSISVK